MRPCHLSGTMEQVIASYFQTDFGQFVLDASAGTIGAIAGVLCGSPFDVIKVGLLRTRSPDPDLFVCVPSGWLGGSRLVHRTIGAAPLLRPSCERRGRQKASEAFGGALLLLRLGR